MSVYLGMVIPTMDGIFDLYEYNVFRYGCATVLTPLLVGQFPALTLEDDGTLTVPDLWEYANRQSYFEHPTEQVKAHNVAVKTEELAQFVEATATCASQCTYECSDDIYAEW